MNYLLDTNSCIYIFVDACPALTERVQAMPEGSIGISAITYAELAVGTYRGKPPSESQLARFIEEFPVLPFELPTADRFGRLPFRRGNFDRLIAGHALSLDLTLITRNTGDFADIPGLRVEDWTQ